MLRSQLLFAVLFFATLVNSGCEPKEPSIPVSPKPPAGDPPQHNVPDPYRQAISSVLDPYLRIQEALANDDFQKARKEFEKIKEKAAELKNLDAANLEQGTRENWRSMSKELDSAVNKMAGTEDLNTTRRSFASMSKELIDTVKKFGHKEAQPLQIYHCPMAMNGAGADWLQRSSDKELSNPYFGAAMLRCGTKKELLAGNCSDCSK